MIYISNYNQWGSSTLDLAFCQWKHCASIFSFQPFALKWTERIDGKQRWLARELTWVSICEMLQRCKRLQKRPLFSISESTTTASMPVLLGEGIGAEESSVWVRRQMESSAGGTVDCSEELQASLATWESRIAVSPHSRLECIYLSTKFTFSLFSCWGQSRFFTYSCSPSTKAFLWDWAAQGAWLTAGTNSGKWGQLKKRSHCAMQRGLIRAQAVRAAQEAVLASC